MDEVDTDKANYGAKVGQVIQGALGRGAGGKFARVGDSAPAQTSAAKLSAEDMTALDVLRKTGKVPDAATLKRLFAAGMVRRLKSGRIALSPDGMLATQGMAKPKGGKGGGGGSAKPQTQIPQRLLDAAQLLSDGKELTQEQIDDLIRNELARIVKKKLVLTKTGLNAITKKAVADGGSMMAVKQADGQWRWVTFSSTAFEDRDGEIVATQALEEDCDFCDHTKEYGPLLWWHEKELVTLGVCDFNMVHGRVLVESGTFCDVAFGGRNYDAAQVAEAIKEHAAELGVSIGFSHSRAYPDREGVYWQIRRKERSLLPAGKASNRLTGVAVQEMDMANKDEKVAALGTLLGNTNAANVLAAADKASADGEDTLRVKEVADEEGDTGDLGEEGDTMTEEAQEDDAQKDLGYGDTTMSEQDFIAQMTRQMFTSMVSDAVYPAVQKAVAEQMAALVTLGQTKEKGEVGSGKGENPSPEAARLAELEKQLAAVTKEMNALKRGLPPSALSGQRSSQSAKTAKEAVEDDGTKPPENRPALGS